MSDKIIASYQLKVHMHRDDEAAPAVPIDIRTNTPPGPSVAALALEVRTVLDDQWTDVGEHWTVSDAQRID